MFLNNIQVTLRRRFNWEASDLGFHLIHHFAGAVYRPWLILLGLLYLPAIWLLKDSPGWLGFYFILTIPLCERAIIFVLSRAVFDKAPGVKETLKAWPKECRPGWFLQLFIFRFFPSRLFLQPIWQLERQKRKKIWTRRRQLMRRDSAVVLWTATTFHIVEVILILSILELMRTFASDTTLTNLMLDLQYEEHLQTLVAYAITILYIATTALLRPFLVACHFSLYLNRRTNLEGWDLEINLRSIAARLKPALSLILLCGLCNLAYGQTEAPRKRFVPNPMRVDRAKEAQEAINRVMAQPEMQTSIEVERYEFGNDDESGPGFNWSLELIAQTLRILLITFAVLVFAYLLYRFIKFHQQGGAASTREVDEPTKIIMGMDLRPESLPENVVQEASRLWHEGDQRAALSLLYRGALSILVNQHHIKLKASFTEADCLQTLETHTTHQTDLPKFFKTLTQTWCLTAYAHHLPSVVHFEQLKNDWQKHLTTNNEVKV